MASSSAQSSGALSGGSVTVLMTGAARLNSLQIVQDGAAAGTVTVYDNTAASGKIIALFQGVAGQPGGFYNFDAPIKCDIGLTVQVSVTITAAIVGYNA